MLVTKIKFEDGSIVIKTAQEIDEKRSKETFYRSSLPPHQDFAIAINNLEKLARHILQLPEEWQKGKVRVTGVSFSYAGEDEVPGAVITGIVGVDTCNSPFCFNTPFLQYEQYNEGGNAPLMPDFGVALLDIVQKEAMAFMNGKSAQGDMFVEEKAAA